MPKPLGREEVRHDPLADDDGLRGHAVRLRVQAEIDNQLFGGARYPAEVRVQGADLGVVNLGLLLRQGPVAQRVRQPSRPGKSLVNRS